MSFEIRRLLALSALAVVLGSPSVRAQQQLPRPAPQAATPAADDDDEEDKPAQGKAVVPPATGGMIPADVVGEEEPGDAEPFQDPSRGCTFESIDFDPCKKAWFGPDNKAGPNGAPLSENAIQEREVIYSLLALAVVNEDWQFSEAEFKPNVAGKPPTFNPATNEFRGFPRRGHNVGGVLVDDKGDLVWWDRNSNTFECSGTNHGETRMMISYLKYSRRSTLGCHTIYTSLEPCAMCSGVMTLQKIGRTLYVQKDHGFGAAVERLQLPHTGRKFNCGYPRTPFARQVLMAGPRDPRTGRRLKSGAAFALDAAYHQFFNTQPPGKGDVTGFLQTPQAHAIYEQAEADLKARLARPPVPGNEKMFQDVARLLNDLRVIYRGTYITPENHVAIERARDKARLRFNAARASVQAGQPAPAGLTQEDLVDPDQGARLLSFRPNPQQILGQLDECCRPKAMQGGPTPGLAPVPNSCPALPATAALTQQRAAERAAKQQKKQ